jgi:hypothetical protein
LVEFPVEVVVDERTLRSDADVVDEHVDFDVPALGLFVQLRGCFPGREVLNDGVGLDSVVVFELLGQGPEFLLASCHEYDIVATRRELLGQRLPDSRRRARHERGSIDCHTRVPSETALKLRAGYPGRLIHSAVRVPLGELPERATAV